MTIAYVNSLEVQEKLNTSVGTLVILFKMKCTDFYYVKT